MTAKEGSPAPARVRSLRIFVAGPWWDTGTLAEYVTAGFRDLGHDVRLFLYSRELNAPIGFRDRVRRRLSGESRFTLERIFDSAREDNVRLLDGVDEFEPDLVLVIKGEVFLPETLHMMKARFDGPLVQWCGDNPFWFPNIIGSVGIYDWFFLADYHYAPDVSRQGAKRVEFLPHAADPETYSIEADEVNGGADVIFVGDSRHQMGHLPENWHRVEMLEAVARTGVDLAVYGRGWDALPSDYTVRNCLRGRTLLPARRVAAAYRASKIVLNVHHPQMVNGCNMRTFEAAACAAFQLVDDRPSLHDLFDPPNDLVTYSSADELNELISYYLSNPDERGAVAARSRERVLRRHTYTERLNGLIEKVTR